jgi:hypothetical protein
VQRLDKASFVNIRKLHATSAGMKCSFDAIHMMVESAPRRGANSRGERGQLLAEGCSSAQHC